MPSRAHPLAPRPGQPYPATFRSPRMDPPGIEPGSPPRQGDVVPLDHGPVEPRVDRRGVEPRSPACEAGVVPLDQQPITRGLPETRTRTASVPGRCAARNTWRPSRESSRQDSNLRYPACKAGVLAARRRDEESRRGGTRTHRHQALDLAALPFCLPGEDEESRVWVSNPAVRVYETRPSTGPPAIQERFPHRDRGRAMGTQWPRGDSNSHARCGHERLRLARLPVPPPGHVAKQPVRESNPPLLAEDQGSLPIDERAMRRPVRRDGVEPPGPEGTWSTATGARQCPADAMRRQSSGTGGSRTHRHGGLSSAALPLCVPCRFHY